MKRIPPPPLVAPNLNVVVADAGYDLDPLEGAGQDGDVATGGIGYQPHPCKIIS